MNRSTKSIFIILMMMAGCFDAVPCPDDDECIDQALAPCTRDAQEPDNTPDAATAIDDLQLFTGNVCQSDDDWFAFTITETTWVGIYLRYDGGLGDLDFELRDAEPGPGTLMAIADGDDVEYSAVEAIHQRLLRPGTYKVRVYLGSGEGDVAYQVRFDLLAAPTMNR